MSVNSIQPSKGQGTAYGGETCRYLAGLDTLVRLRTSLSVEAV
jgi:hypothetical protein